MTDQPDREGDDRRVRVREPYNVLRHPERTGPLTPQERAHLANWVEHADACTAPTGEGYPITTARVVDCVRRLLEHG